MKSCVVGESWRLRAGTPVPVCVDSSSENCLCDTQTGPRYNFLFQSFGAEKRETINYKATTELAESMDFIGINAEGTLESASYQGTNYVSNEGEMFFSGQEQKRVSYHQESEAPGVNGLIDGIL